MSHERDVAGAAYRLLNNIDPMDTWLTFCPQLIDMLAFAPLDCHAFLNSIKGHQPKCQNLSSNFSHSNPNPFHYTNLSLQNIAVLL